MNKMNNSDFRKLVSTKPASKEDGASPSSSIPGALGAKKSAFLGMTPRPGKAPSTADFARQVREQHASMRPTKKFKSSAPKGSKFAAGYTDRAKARQEAEDEEDDKAKRIKALEEQWKLEQISRETFEALRDEITGGDASSTHLIKGLDRKLLERVRRGEDVLGLGKSGENSEASAPVDVDDELEKMGEKEIEAVKRAHSEKRGVKAPSPVAGKKRSRDEIMAELKAQRKAAAEARAAAAPSLGDKWRRVGDQAKPKVEIDHKGREVVTIVNDDGTVKKMIRKAQNSSDAKTALDAPDASKPVLGADVAVPEQPKQAEPEDSDDDIFEGAGTDYNPLGNVDDDDDDDDESDSDHEKPTKEPTKQPVSEERADSSDAERSEEGEVEEPKTESKPTVRSQPEAPKAARNYFGETPQSEETEKDRFNGVVDVIKKAAKLGSERFGADEGDEDEDEETRKERLARAARRKQMLEQRDRDMEDMDMGFGGSRGEDEADFEDAKIKLSEWKGSVAAGDDDDEKGGKGGGKKKRKPKKRKGDVNNAADIMRVIEGRKAGGSK